MKKFIFIFISFIFSIIFFINYDSFNYANYIQTLDIPNTIVQKQNKSLYMLEVENIQDNEKKNVVGEILTLSEPGLIILRDRPSTDSSYNITRNYILTNNLDLNNIFHLKNNKDAKFDGSMFNFYFTTNQSDNLAFDYLISFNSKYFIEESECVDVLPMTDYMNMNLTKTDDFMIYTDDVKTLESINQIIQYYNIENNAQITTQDITGKWKFSSESELYELKHRELSLVLYLCCSVLILCICCLISSKNKEIMIRKMHGESTLQIMKNLYWKFFMFLLIYTVIFQALLWGLFINSNNALYESFNLKFIQLTIGYIAFIPILFIIMYFYINATISLKHLKSNNSNYLLLKTNMFLKVVFTISLILPFSSTIKSAIPILQGFEVMSQHEELIKSYLSIGTMRQNSQTAEVLLNEFPYADFNDYEANGINYDLYFGSDNKFINEEDVKMPYPYVVANAKYLSDYEIKDIEGNLLNWENIPDNILLIPENYKINNMKPYCGISECNTIIIQKTNRFLNYDPLGVVHYLDNPIVRLVKTANHINIQPLKFFLPTTSTQGKQYYEQYINTLTNSNKTITVSNTSRFDMYRAKLQSTIWTLFIMVILYMSVYSIFLYQYLVLLFHRNKKDYVIKYLLGYSKWERYHEIFLFNVFIYTISSCVCIFLLSASLSDILIFLVPAIIFDSILQLIYIKNFHKKQAAEILKGEII